MKYLESKFEKLRSLLVDSQGGDKQSYDQFFEKLIPFVREVVKQRTGYVNEDIVQEALISVHNARHTYDSSRPIAPWLISIIKFRIADNKRLYWSNSNKLIQYALLNEIDFSTTNDQNLNSDVYEAINNLPERQRKILWYSKVEGYSLKEISEKLDLNLPVVKVTAHRAYLKLRSLLQRR